MLGYDLSKRMMYTRRKRVAHKVSETSYLTLGTLRITNRSYNNASSVFKNYKQRTLFMIKSLNHLIKILYNLPTIIQCSLLDRGC